MRKTASLIVILVIAALIVGCTQSKVGKEDYKEVTVYKSATCGCCVSYIGELKKYGFKVKAVNIEDMSAIKKQHSIPRRMESCHTMVIGDYFVEGHVPIVAVQRLLDEKPAIDGIALPDMPSGSPGMPGTKMEPFKIYALTKGQIKDFMII